MTPWASEAKSGHQRTVSITGRLRPHLEAHAATPHEPHYLVFVGGRPRGAGRSDPARDRIAAPGKALKRALRADGIERHRSMHDTAPRRCTSTPAPRRAALQEALGNSSLLMSSRYAHVTGKKVESELPCGDKRADDGDAGDG